MNTIKNILANAITLVCVTAQKNVPVLMNNDTSISMYLEDAQCHTLKKPEENYSYFLKERFPSTWKHVSLVRCITQLTPGKALVATRFILPKNKYDNDHIIYIENNMIVYTDLLYADNNDDMINPIKDIHIDREDENEVKKSAVQRLRIIGDSSTMYPHAIEIG